MPKAKINDAVDEELSKLIEQDATQNQKMLAEPEQEWLEDEEEYEGQLSVDVYQDKKNIYIKSAIAGVKAEDIDINLNNDTITIKGFRKHDQEVSEDDYYYKECYWGGFSRSIILPVDIKTDRVDASVDNGILTIILPKAEQSKVRNIEVKEINIEAEKKPVPTETTEDKPKLKKKKGRPLKTRK